MIVRVMEHKTIQNAAQQYVNAQFSAFCAEFHANQSPQASGFKHLIVGNIHR